MKLAVISDIHSKNGRLIPRDVDADVYIWAGDIGDPYLVSELIETEFSHIPVIYVPGNHEYYHYNKTIVDEDIFNGDIGYNNHSTIINDTRFISSTLWSNLDNPLDGFNYDRWMNDCNYIQLWNSSRANSAHKESLQWLNENIKEGDIVITHHSPSYQGTVERFKGDALNASFHSNLDEFILEKKPALWIHGHIHDSVDYMIGETRVVCHPLGYRHERNPEFYEPLIIEI